MKISFKLILMLPALWVVGNIAQAQTPVEKGLKYITTTNAKRYIGVLAADSLGGRRVGSANGAKAARYIEQQLRQMGVKPLDGKYVHSFEITRNGHKTVNGKRKDTTIVLKMNNVLGIIEGEKKDEFVAIGAHYDHLGTENNAFKKDKIYNGADDNASGTAGILQIAQALIKCGKKPLRSVIIGFWDGEEVGLWGSQHFADSGAYTSKIKCYVNLDMIGHNDTKEGNPQYLEYNYTVSDFIFFKWMKDAVSTYNLNLKVDYKALGKDVYNSDHSSFIKHDIPSVFFFTGLHPNYHKTSDEVDKIDWNKTIDVTKAAFVITWQMANTTFK